MRGPGPWLLCPTHCLWRTKRASAAATQASVCSFAALIGRLRPRLGPRCGPVVAGRGQLRPRVGPRQQGGPLFASSLEPCALLTTSGWGGLLLGHCVICCPACAPAWSVPVCPARCAARAPARCVSQCIFHNQRGGWRGGTFCNCMPCGLWGTGGWWVSGVRAGARGRGSRESKMVRVPLACPKLVSRGVEAGGDYSGPSENIVARL